MQKLRQEEINGKIRNIFLCCGTEIYFTVHEYYDDSENACLGIQKEFKKWELNGNYHYCTEVPKYEKTCNICQEPILLWKIGNTWNKSNLDGSKHDKHIDGILRPCLKCGQNVILTKNGIKWQKFNLDNSEHIHLDMRKKENRAKKEQIPFIEIN